ncbi:MAG TPA: alkaline phosphatase D family protein [Actinomycetales bacterium]|jgi:alkaline phosphatase D
MPEPVDRRTLLRSGLLLGGAGAVSLALPSAASAAPTLVRPRPELVYGVQSGDVTAGTAVVWARADRPARMRVEVSPTPEFRRPRTYRGPLMTSGSDLTGKVLLTGLPAAADVFYRVTLADPDSDRTTGEPVVGAFRTPSAGGRRTQRDIRFVWSGDLAGQGWGINPEVGGYRIFREMRRLDPDFFLCSGDTVYADGPVLPSVTLPDGRVWRNVVTQEKSKVAETLDEFRGQFRYNLIDDNLRAMNAVVPQMNQWDDHEVTNNWYPGEVLDDPRYQLERSTDVLAARGRQAFFEYLPIREQRAQDGRIYRVNRYGPLLDVFVLDMRSYKDANTPGLESAADGGVFGARQLRWLKQQLRASTATWKVIAADLPIGLVVPDGDTAIEGIGQGAPGAPAGRELEVADLLSFIARQDITGTVWLTADVHYTAAHRYEPSRATFTDFLPFWEFVSGPLNAGAFGPNALDPTFGPEAVFVAAPPRANTSPLEGSQFFGEVSIDGGSRVMTVRLRDLDGAVLHTQRLQPAG